MSRFHGQPAPYLIKGPGHLDENWSDWGKRTKPVESGCDDPPVTTLTSTVDQDRIDVVEVGATGLCSTRARWLVGLGADQVWLFTWYGPIALRLGIVIIVLGILGLYGVCRKRERSVTHPTQR